ncbi:hypothetical protein EST38_g12369 [Candolleomyces aberdarensis]|uniref:Uncharacterized protein n=1 Tax=Candolleomyces aberdarensis TaxID=2316362 RepID=A0A4Q2D3D2_9AGAR|nr:hypothetical protein EST38_g12369 [Candolleomyces aberdarensis]
MPDPSSILACDSDPNPGGFIDDKAKDNVQGNVTANEEDLALDNDDDSDSEGSMLAVVVGPTNDPPPGQEPENDKDKETFAMDADAVYLPKTPSIPHMTYQISSHLASGQGLSILRNNSFILDALKSLASTRTDNFADEPDEDCQLDLETLLQTFLPKADVKVEDSVIEHDHPVKQNKGKGKQKVLDPVGEPSSGHVEENNSADVDASKMFFSRWFLPLTGIIFILSNS